ncbi:unnamed protein product [Closterium sp. NIES-53]
MAPGQQASAEGMAVEGAEDEGEADLAATTSMEAAGVADTAAIKGAMDAVEADSTASANIFRRADICGAIASSSLMDEPLLKAKRVEEQEEGEEEAVEAVVVSEEPAAVGKVTLHSLDYWVIDSGATYSMTPRADLLTELELSPVKHVTSALGQQAQVKGMGKAMFKGADGKMVGLKNVIWVPNLAANLISVRRLQKAGMDTSSKGAKTYTARLGERILWDLYEDRDVYNEMWQIPVVPMPKERQVAASISTKGEVVGSDNGTNGRAKEMKSKKCNLGGTSKLGEHDESGVAAQKQHKGEENPKAAAEEEYGENMWGTIASAAFSNPTSTTGECDWLTLHRGMGHVALPILQQLVKNEMVAGIRVKGEPDEVLGCPTCMQAKFTCYLFSSSEAIAKAPLDEVVMDVVGPLKLGAAGAEYFLIIVDVYTRMTWVYVLSEKSDVAETVKTDWLLMVERQPDRLVKAILTDRGGEFLSKDFQLWLKKNGIRHSLTMPYSPAMKGIAERANWTITETARGLLIEAGLPEYVWPDAVDMLRVFGCMCMALVPKHLRHNKLGAKAIWAVHLGMAQNCKGWLLWDPFTKKFLVSRDCKFMENLMYKDWKAENEAKIGMRFGEVKSSGLENVELPLELSSSSITTRQSSLVNGGEESKGAEEEEEEVQQVSERALTLPSRTTSAPRIRVTPQQRQGLHVPAAEEEGVIHQPPLLEVICNGRRLQGLVDSGASHSVCDQGTLEKIGESSEETQFTTTMVDGTKLPIHGKRTLQLQIGASRWKPTLPITNIKGLDFILGRDFLKRFSPEIDWVNRKACIYNNGKCVDLRSWTDTGNVPETTLALFKRTVNESITGYLALDMAAAEEEKPNTELLAAIKELLVSES